MSEHLGKNLRYLRKQKGKSCAAVAREFFTDDREVINFRNSLNHWENDRVKPSLNTLVDLANYYGVDVGELITKNLRK